MIPRVAGILLLCAVPTSASSTTPSSRRALQQQPTECADFTGVKGKADGLVDVEDLLGVLAAFGKGGAANVRKNGSGVVDVEDLLLVLSSFGTRCSVTAISSVPFDLQRDANNMKGWKVFVSHPKPTEGVEHLGFTPLRCRAVRLDIDQSTCKVNNYARVYELELFSNSKNVALRKPAKADSSYASYTPNKAFDGNTKSATSRWLGAPTHPKHWLVVDLKKTYTIDNAKLYGYKNYGLCSHTLSCWIGAPPPPPSPFNLARDAASTTGWTPFVNHPKPTEGVEHLGFAPVTCQAVRLDIDQSTCKVNNYARVYELELFSKNKNVALRKPAKADSSHASYTPDKAFDGDTKSVKSRWLGAPSHPKHWLVVDLKAPIRIDAAKLYGYKGYGLCSHTLSCWTGSSSPTAKKCNTFTCNKGFHLKPFAKKINQGSQPSTACCLRDQLPPAPFNLARDAGSKTGWTKFLSHKYTERVSHAGFTPRRCNAVRLDINQATCRVSNHARVYELEIYSNDVNVALKKKVKADSHFASYVASKAVDGNTKSVESRWLGAPSHPNHWLVVDLGGIHTIEAVSIYGYKKHGLCQHTLSCWTGPPPPPPPPFNIARDSTSRTGWTMFTSGRLHGKTKAEHLAFTPLRCNAIRMDVDQSVCSVSNHARVLELQIFSKDKNVALRKPTRADSVYGPAKGSCDATGKTKCESGRAVDGKTSGNYNRWLSTPAKPKHWLVIDLKKTYTVDAATLYAGFSGKDGLCKHTLSCWTGSVTGKCNGNENRRENVRCAKGTVLKLAGNKINRGRNPQKACCMKTPPAVPFNLRTDAKNAKGWKVFVKHDKPTEGVEHLGFAPVRCSAVRLDVDMSKCKKTSKNSVGNYARVYELELFSDSVNVALKRPAIADSSWKGRTPDKAFDGIKWDKKTMSRWVGNPSTGAKHWLAVDLGTTYEISSADLYGYPGYGLCSHTLSCWVGTSTAGR